MRELLVTGQVLPAFRESGDPTEPRASEIEVTAKPKAQTLARFADAAEEAYGGAGEPVAPTIVTKELMSLMLTTALDPRSPGQPSVALTTALDAMFSAFSADGATFTAAEEQVWRTAIDSDGVLMTS